MNEDIVDYTSGPYQQFTEEPRMQELDIIDEKEELVTNDYKRNDKKRSNTKKRSDKKRSNKKTTGGKKVGNKKTGSKRSSKRSYKRNQRLIHATSI
jgi:hypothetical protein